MPELKEILPSAARSASLTTGSGITAPYGWKRLTALLDITALSGAGTLSVYLQQTPDGGATWHDVGAFDTFTGSSAARLVLELDAGGGNSDPSYALTDRGLAAGSVLKVRWPEKLRAVSTHAGYTSVTWSVIGYWE
jgi:hypothetical protein